VQRAGVMFFGVVWWVFASLLLAGVAVAQEPPPEEPPAGQAQYAGDGCIPITTLSGNTADSTEPFGIGATTLRVVYETTPANNRGFNSTDISVVDETAQAGGTQIDSVEAVEGEDGVLEVPLQAGRYSVQVETFEQSYEIVVEAAGGEEPCTQAAESPGNDPGDADDPDDVMDDTIPEDKDVLANTGGFPILVGAALMLVAATVLGSRVIGRR